MLTTTAIFDKYNMRPNIESSKIVKITGGSTTFYFSDRIINLSDSSIVTEGVIVDFGTLNQKIDLFNKVSSISNVKLKLVNAPYSVSTAGAGPVCLSDVLAADNIFNAAVEIYFWYEGIIDIDDCLKLFDGLAQPMTKANPETLELNILDNSVFYHRTVPTDLVDVTTFPNAPKESIGKVIPLVYGDVSLDDVQKGGLVEGIWIDGSKILFAGHVLKSISNIWILDEILDKLVKIDSSDWTATLDDGGKATVEIDDMIDTVAHLYHYPSRRIIEQDAFYTSFPFTDGEKVNDLDSSTYATVNTPWSAPNSPPATGSGTIKAYVDKLAEAGTIQAAYIELNYSTTNPSYINTSEFWFDGVTGGTGDVKMDLTADGGDVWNSLDISNQWAGGVPTWVSFGNSLLRRFAIFCDLDRANGIEVHKLREMRMRIKYEIDIKVGWRIFAECEGRKFGSWIDEGGRSNSYNEGDLIENPAHIVESILRDELSLTASDVDVASFDSVGGDLSSWDMAMAINTPIRTDNLFAKIGFQSKTHTFFDSQGTAKIGILDDTGTSNDDSFGKDDVKQGKIFLIQGDMKQLINSVDVLWAPEILDPESGYQKNSSATNSGSITEYSITKHRTLQADYILDDTVAGNFSDHFVDSGGYWKDLQEIIDATKAHWKFIYLEIGDIIDPETSINDVLKLFNDSFGDSPGSPLFIITEKKIGKDLRFKLQRMGSGPGA